jgi:hypothetical protein
VEKKIINIHEIFGKLRENNLDLGKIFLNKKYDQTRYIILF